MQIHEPGLYHIYNRGNFRQRLFFTDDNYLFFLDKCHQYLLPFSDVLSWCLMLDHFHFQLHISQGGIAPVRIGNLLMPAIFNGFRLLQSSYAKAINKQQQVFGNLFQQKTKAKLIISPEHAVTTFHYIHQNPVKAKMVDRPDQWAFSSFKDYMGLRSGKLCNKEKAIELLGLEGLDLWNETRQEITPERTRWIF
jgi:putative transposase